jgi:hypothetical protein
MRTSIDRIYYTTIYSSLIDDLNAVQDEMYGVFNKLEFDYYPRFGKTHKLNPNPFDGNLVDEYDMQLTKKMIDDNMVNYYASLQSVYKPYKITHSWFTKSEYNDYASVHSHGEADISGVYYVQTTGEDGTIFFKSPASVARLHPLFGHSSNFIHKPIVGKLLLFPGFVEHGVRTNETNDTRISFSFNIKLL